jgi:hypothetical protein
MMQYIDSYDLKVFVASELKELVTRDVDTLFECIKDNIEEMKLRVTDDDLYSALENALGEELA